jgi:Fe-S oxidoreductase
LKAANNPHQPIAGEQPVPPAVLPALLADIAQRCTECGACLRDCAFLARYGSPGSIAARFADTLPDQHMAYACNLCGLCSTVCPERLDPCRLFLEIRRRHVSGGSFTSRPYRALLFYERLGLSDLFSWFGLPKDCSTVFFPGCALAGTRPATTLRMFFGLRTRIPSLGMVLKCCAKPSHDLGRSEFFRVHFQPIVDQLHRHGVTTVLTACPSCTRIFRQYGQGLRVETVFTHLYTTEASSRHPTANLEACVHDPCALRDDHASQEAVRGLVRQMGYTVVPMRHQQRTTLCCGEGGAVGFSAPEFAVAWTRKRRDEANGRLIISSCAGCTAMLGRATPTLHLADGLFPPAPGQRSPAPARPPLTYLNRLLLKNRLQKLLHM